jgi:hypothetical protein
LAASTLIILFAKNVEIFKIRFFGEKIFCEGKWEDILKYSGTFFCFDMESLILIN